MEEKELRGERVGIELDTFSNSEEIMQVTKREWART